MPLIKDPSEMEKNSKENNKTNDKQDIERDQADDLTKEVEKANTEMKRRNDEENNGIQDLIGKKDDSSASSNNRQVQASSVSENTGQEQKERIRTVTYPYWSWTPCYKCVTKRPPRCHHCDLCGACILKRDHHCYFAGSCVGYRNMRFFFIFLIWSFLGSMWATINGFPYIYTYLWDDMSYVDIVFFFAIIRWIFGYVSFQAALSVTTLSLLIYFDIITTMFIFTHGSLIRQGITSFEKVYLKKSLVIQDTRSLGGKLRAVFGKNWFVMLFIPIHFFVEPEEDPVNWPYVKAIKN